MIQFDAAPRQAHRDHAGYALINAKVESHDGPFPAAAIVAGGRGTGAARPWREPATWRAPRRWGPPARQPTPGRDKNRFIGATMSKIPELLAVDEPKAQGGRLGVYS
jgi:hypothetical protein